MTESIIQLAWGACTDRGLRRQVNEDSFVAEPPVFFVADGMGGHEAGAEASRAALAGFRALAGAESVGVAQVEEAFRDAVSAVRSIETDRTAAGTTLSGAAVTEQGGAPYWLILNIGDSRTYRFARGRLDQVSIDHSAVQDLVDRGQLDAHEAERHPQRNVVTRAVGAGSVGAPDYWLLPASTGDRILICSDGLSKELSSDEIARVLGGEESPQAAAQRLVHEALLHGGRDNVTVVIVDAHGVVDRDDDATAPGGDVDEDTVPRSSGSEGDRVAQIQPR